MQPGMAPPPPAQCSALRIFETEQEQEIAAMDGVPLYSKWSPPLSAPLIGALLGRPFIPSQRTLWLGSANSYRTPRIR